MSTFIRLTDYKSSDEKEQEFFNSENRYEAEQGNFEMIPGSPIAYWVSKKVNEIFEDSQKVGDLYDIKQGMATSDNNRFIRYWTEVLFDKVGFNLNNLEEANSLTYKWFPYNKGGEYRKWYGNNEYIVNYENDGFELKEFQSTLSQGWSVRLKSREFYFQESISWGLVSSDKFNVRFYPTGSIIDIGSNSLYADNKLFYLSLFNSKFINNILKVINPSMNFPPIAIKALPIVYPETNILKEKINQLTQQNIDISKEEWDSRETSWDFTQNELIKHKIDSKIETSYSNFCNYWQEQHNTLHQNEEELNRLFIDIYELQDELTPDVELKDITILKNETKIIDGVLVFQADEIMKQFISYGVGVMFGRYSLDSDGLLIANMGQEVPTDTTFEIDDDNVIPVLEDDYFKDDIASRFVQFVKTTFGEEDLSENIRFIESSLGTTIRKYFVKGFYEDHIKRYKKRPIYWMVSSPNKSFNALFYMHRYESDIFARVQNNYLREYVAKLEATKQTLHVVSGDESNSATERSKATKEMDNITKKIDEIIKYDRDHLTSFAQSKTEIDLDDGVKVNYCKFKDILYEFDKKLCD